MLLTTVRRFFLWLAICSVSAAPSFVIATMSGYSVPAMLTAVLLFTVLYTVATSLPWFERLRAVRFVRRTLYIGYATRLVLSALAVVPPVMFVDMVGGIMSVGITNELFPGFEAGERNGFNNATLFAATFTATIIQGCLLNAVLFVYMVLMWVAQTMFCKPPRERAAFEVIMPTATPTTPARAVPVADPPTTSA